MLAIAEHLHAVRRRGVLVHFAEDRFQRLDHRLFAVKVQRTHFVPRVAIQQVDAADQAFLLFAEAENIQLTEIEVHHLVTEGRGWVIFEVDDNRQWRISHGLYSAFGVGAGRRSGKWCDTSATISCSFARSTMPLPLINRRVREVSRPLNQPVPPAY